MSQMPASPEKKGVKKSLVVLIVLVAMAAAFALGWRVMPKVWPGIKSALTGSPAKVEAKADAAAKPAAGSHEAQRELYTPAATAGFDDEILAEDSLIYYFYKDYCPYCKELDPLIAGLPKAITLPDGRTSAVKLVCLKKNTAEGEVADPAKDPANIIAAYYRDHNVPEDRQLVPALVIGDRYLFTRNEIIPQLLDALVQGEGLKTPLLNGAERVSVE